MINKPIPYGRQHITDEDIQAVVDTLKSNYLTQGPKIKEFETKFAEYVGADYADFPMPSNGFIGSGGRDREDRQYKERTVPFAGCHAIRRTKGSGRRK